MFNKIPTRFRSFYFITAACFVLWMLFLDNNDLFSRFKLSRKMNSLENEKEYYQEKIKEVEQDRDELFGDKESIEKFAREKYLMKKENEDIFIVKEE
jgi:cell division protein FtsB